MSGRYEKEMQMDRNVRKKLQDLPSVVSDYYYSLIGSGKAYSTAEEYIKCIESFLKFTFPDGYNGDFYTEVKSIHINRYITFLRTKTVNGVPMRTSDSFRSTRWSELNSFFQFLIPEYIHENPVANTTRPKMKDNPEIAYLNPEEILKVLDNTSKMSSDVFRNRNLCLLKLGFSTGLRVSAIVGINLSDLDLEHNQINVIEKGDRDRRIIIGENLKQQIILWLEDRKKYFSDVDNDALFISNNFTRITTQAVGKLLRKYANGVTDKHMHPHIMRHSCATNLYEQTGDIYLCAKQLGHAQVSTTQRYAELSKTKRIEAANILDGMISKT